MSRVTVKTDWGEILWEAVLAPNDDITVVLEGGDHELGEVHWEEKS